MDRRLQVNTRDLSEGWKGKGVVVKVRCPCLQPGCHPRQLGPCDCSFPQQPRQEGMPTLSDAHIQPNSHWRDVRSLSS